MSTNNKVQVPYRSDIVSTTQNKPDNGLSTLGVHRIIAKVIF